MNTNTIQGSWEEIKGKIKTRWGKITDDEIETLKGNLDQLAGKIQKSYGHTKDQAESEYKEFKTSLGTAATNLKEAIKEGIIYAAHAVEDKVKNSVPSDIPSANIAPDKTAVAVDSAVKYTKKTTNNKHGVVKHGHSRHT